MLCGRPLPAAPESPEEGGEKGAGGEVGGGEEASEHGAPGPTSPSQPAAGARQEGPAGRTQPGATHPRPKAAQPESARHPAGGQEGQPTEVSRDLAVMGHTSHWYLVMDQCRPSET